MTNRLRRNSYLSWFLVFSLMMQPLLFDATLQAAEGDAQVKQVEESNTQTQKAKTDIDAIDTSKWTIKLSTLDKIGISIGNFFKKGLKDKIKKAQKELEKAKTEFTASKTKVGEAATKSVKATADTKAAAAKSDSASTKANLQAAASATSAAQTALRGVGEMLQGISTILSAAAMVIGLAGKGCTALSAIPYVGPIIGAVGVILSGAAGLLTKVAAVIKVAGLAVISAANAAQISETDFSKFASDAAAAWKNSGNEYFASAKKTGAEGSEEAAAGSAKETVKGDPDTDKPAAPEPTAASDVGVDKGELVVPDDKDSKASGNEEVIEEPVMPNANEL